MHVALNSARAYDDAIAKAYDAGQTTRFDAAGAILMASESAVKVSLEATQALGGAGHTKEFRVECMPADLRPYDIGAGAHAVGRVLIGPEFVRE
jgi:isovaleryl-CoA dehydrogenase